MVSEPDSYTPNTVEAFSRIHVLSDVRIALPAGNEMSRGIKSLTDNAGHDDTCSELHVGGGF
ncbi:MAG: hypothetical protein EA353_02710 [Puniceicoccaceae bacterium]|nr:MAG: hypothetical protein EA353_02710 [Puniceicoccaceae bacterium]